MGELHQPQGPSNETLRRLYGSLPSMAKGVREGKIGGKGTKAPVRHATKVCNVCFKAFDFKEGPPPERDKIIEKEAIRLPCEDCDAKLKAGFTALVSGHKYAFVKSVKLMDMAGQIIPISPHVMTKVQSEYDAEWKDAEPTEPIEPNTNGDPPPSPDGTG